MEVVWLEWKVERREVEKMERREGEGGVFIQAVQLRLIRQVAGLCTALEN